MTVTPPELDQPPQVVIEGGRSAPSGPSRALAIWIGLAAALALAVVVIGPGQITLPEASERADPGLAAVEWPAWTETFPGPDPVLPATLTATANGFAVVGGPETPSPTVWHLQPDGTWLASELPTIPFGLVADGERIVAFRGDLGWTLAPAGEEWTIAAEFELPTPVRLGYGSSRPGVTAVSGGLLVESLDGALLLVDGGEATVVIDEGVWGRASEGAWEDFTGPRNTGPCRIDSVVSNDYVPVAVGDPGIIAIVGGGDGRAHGLWPACSPRVWSSTDGSVWTPLTDDSPFGAVAYVADIAWRQDRYLAVGGVGSTPKVWQSRDGVAWTDATPLPIRVGGDHVVLVDVESGPAGWAIVAEQSDRSHHSGWVSPDGSCWFRVPIAASGGRVAVGTEAFAVAGAGRSNGVWIGQAPTADPDPCP